MPLPQGGNPAIQNALRDASTCSALYSHDQLQDTATRSTFASAMFPQGHRTLQTDRTFDEGPCPQRCKICNPHGRWVARPNSALLPSSYASAAGSKLPHLLGISPYATNLEGQLAKHCEGVKEKPDHMVEQSRDEYRRCTVACDSVVDRLRFATPTYANGALVLGSANHTAISHKSCSGSP